MNVTNKNTEEKQQRKSKKKKNAQQNKYIVVFAHIKTHAAERYGSIYLHMCVEV